MREAVLMGFLVGIQIAQGGSIIEIGEDVYWRSLMHLPNVADLPAKMKQVCVLIVYLQYTAAMSSALALQGADGLIQIATQAAQAVRKAQ